MKTCKRCKEEKPLDQFGKNMHQEDGLNYYCKECERKRAMGYRRPRQCPHCGKPNERPGEACNTCARIYSHAWGMARASGASMAEAKKWAADELQAFNECFEEEFGAVPFGKEV